MTPFATKTEALQAVLHLKSVYAYQFTGPHIGLGMYLGWIPLVVQACTAVDELLGPDKRGFHWVQIKEKFGELRMYYEMENFRTQVIDIRSPEGRITMTHQPDGADTLAVTLHERLAEILQKSGECCIVCGAPAPMRDNAGYFLPLCDQHTVRQLGSGGYRQLNAIWEAAVVNEAGAKL
jgi:hypothetical protein